MSRRLPALAALACLSLAGAAFADPLGDAMALARKTLAFVERSAPRPQFAAELAALEKRVAAARKRPEAEGARGEGKTEQAVPSGLDPLASGLYSEVR